MWQEFLKQQLPSYQIRDQLTLAPIGLNLSQPYVTFLDDHRYLTRLSEDHLASVVLTSRSLSEQVLQLNREVHVCEDPRWLFFSAYNLLAEGRLSVETPSLVDPSAHVSSLAYISPNDVKIGANVTIEAGVVIHPRVTIRNDSIVRSGAVIGSSGHEYKRTTRGIIDVVHDGSVEVGMGCEIGPNTVVGQGFWLRNTRLGDFVKVDALVLIAHGSSIGDQTFIAGGSVIAGSVTIEKEVWIGPGVVIANGVKVGPRSLIALGSHVFRDVEQGKGVIGFPARSFFRGETP